MKNIFIDRISVYDKKFHEFDKQSKVLGNLKLVLVGILFISLFNSVRNQSSFFRILSLITFLILFFVWAYHLKIMHKSDYNEKMKTINEEYLHRITGEWVAFKNNGDEFVASKHPYSVDIDIVGRTSLYQLLTVANSHLGKEAFSNDLLYSDYSKNEILHRQEAILELSEKLEFSQDFQVESSKIKSDKNILNFSASLNDKKKFINSNFLRLILKFMPVIITPVFLLIFTFSLSQFYYLALALLFLQALIWIVHIVKANNYFGNVSEISPVLNQYTSIIKLIESEDFESEELVKIKDLLYSSEFSAFKAMTELDKIYSRANLKANFIAYALANIFLLWDIETASKLDTWKEKYAHKFSKWIEAIAKLESLLSFSTLILIDENTVFPEILDERAIFEAENIGHPLLNKEKRVENNFELDNEIAIISGSNMSGKTTFLRTIAVNLLLAKNGSAVCAKTMSCSLMDIVSSMRISDDLSEGISTFYAELNKVKNIIEYAKSNTNVIFFIDEIFKGTNSKDRLLGAKSVIEKLESLNAVGFVTTHDLELTDMVKGGNIVNYSFSEDYVDKKMFFDYKIEDGVSKTTNAEFLMRMVGIID